MIDTTEQTPKRTTMLKLGKGRLNNSRRQEMEDSMQQCPFTECGRKFVTDQELKGHLHRRHKPKEQVESPSPAEESKKMTRFNVPPKDVAPSTPIPTASKIGNAEVF